MKLVVEGPKIVTLFLEIPYKMNLCPSAPVKLCYTPWNFQGQKPRLSWSPLETVGNANSYFNWPMEFPHYIFSIYTPKKFQVLTGFPIVGRVWGGYPTPPCVQFFRKTPHQTSCSSIGHRLPHLKMKPPTPLKREAPFHEMIPRKSTINNNLKSS